MIVGFATRGQGRGSGPVGYCVQETVTQAKKGTHTRTPPPTVLRGDPAATEQLIDSLEFRYRYKSGVLSFAPGEVITPEQEQNIMDRFEKVAFAGLHPDQYNILWVRHEHAGHHELHFVTPRVELTTGKSLNICPPGRGARAAYDDFRSMINAEYGLADPDDPARERDIQHPPGDRKAVEWEDLGLPEGVSAAKRRMELRDLAHSLIAKRVEAGLIRDRDSLLEQVHELGFSVTRASKSSITLLHPDDPEETRFKMKGAIYGAGWELESTLEAANQPRERDYSRCDSRAAERYAERVEGHIQKRAEYNRSRYAPRDETSGQAVPGLDAVAEPAPGDDLAGYLRRGLGVDAVPVSDDPAAAADAAGTRHQGRGTDRAEREGVPIDAEERDSETAGVGPDLHRGAVNDGIGEDAARRVRAIREAAERAAESARRCVDRAGACLKRIRGVEPASDYLAAAVGRIENLVLDREAEKSSLMLEKDSKEKPSESKMDSQDLNRKSNSPGPIDASRNFKF
ncbi:relaxase/mobilization nuclease domain-containing protein [Halomonas sp. TBZ9]|uniref:Relaxase/mobilization nuclease domain-containing protein n=1 Tax=Vreelandella azerica TaxID=2732867 RepID=A0A7Y3U2B0_9GAMM|nr:relaxase/mobilization nuclease domain-containing protein [Halomonas azerica]NOG32929.1 relaxase/mobilization nuclease domain-containing protein [Halomonas azerica]